MAIENARLYQAARDRLAELSAVIDVARVVSSSLELEEVLGAGAEHLMRTLESPACTILLGDVRGRALRRAAFRGAPVGAERLPLDEPSLARTALEARAPGHRARGRRARGAAAVLAVPLHVRDQPVGVALVAGAGSRSARSRPASSPGQWRSRASSPSPWTTRASTRRPAAAPRSSRCSTRSAARLATLDIEQVLGDGVKNLARIVDCPAAFLALGARRRRRGSRSAPWPGRSAALLGLRIPSPASTALGALVLERREPVAIEDADEDPRVAAEAARAHGRARVPRASRSSCASATIGVGGRRRDARGPRRFTSAEVERAAAVANQLAVAAENARLYEDLRKSYAELARAQRQLIQQERLAALGELSGGRRPRGAQPARRHLQLARLAPAPASARPATRSCSSTSWARRRTG